ncbi:hypothetical protein EDB92DRAFT_1813148 [Lactarius akahatsu]|uniref:Uncharacterized protein n=1 Tax=Lactarius akahatsu TaxID=416441 RepID=A0AAD4QHB2_9AGAM|nr:hypothetical protein EDB92DRAFT_1813148 [Lactarius akahatsu]
MSDTLATTRVATCSSNATTHPGLVDATPKQKYGEKSKKQQAKEWKEEEARKKKDVICKIGDIEERMAENKMLLLTKDTDIMDPKDIEGTDDKVATDTNALEKPPKKKAKPDKVPLHDSISQEIDDPLSVAKGQKRKQIIISDNDDTASEGKGKKTSRFGTMTWIKTILLIERGRENHISMNKRTTQSPPGTLTPRSKTGEKSQPSNQVCNDNIMEIADGPLPEHDETKGPEHNFAIKSPLKGRKCITSLPIVKLKDSHITKASHKRPRNGELPEEWMEDGTWHKTVIPTLFCWASVQPNPWVIPDVKVIAALETICRAIFSDSEVIEEVISPTSTAVHLV